MSPLELAPRILAGTPPWVWAVLLLLVVLGARRLKPKRTRLATAALAPAAFVVWSLSGALALARAGSPGLAPAVWVGALGAGALTVLIHRGPRPAHLGGGLFAFPATAAPLLLYLAVFWARYALGVWAALEPALAFELGLIAVAISAATAGRFLADFAPLLRTALSPARPALLEG